MRKFINLWSIFCVLIMVVFLPLTYVRAENNGGELSLYATSAALVDADNGRVLYGKNCDTPMAMASTTKIMTCIVVLENLDLDEEVSVSPYAETMPKVKLYVKKGEKYTVRDLLFSMMLESHNDSAVVLAEHLGKKYLSEELRDKDVSEYTSEESKKALSAFALLMNKKAEELGCVNTHFITPNGLDATETITKENGESITYEHCTTASELARIMSYCILDSPKRDLFREITGMPAYSFSCNGRNYNCVNHNAFLTMMDGAFSGKTGFTNKAGYCYVGALERDGRTYVVALLACGWPNNKSYKWKDTGELMTYGIENYTYNDFSPEVFTDDIDVIGGASDSGNPYTKVALKVERSGGMLPIHLLTCEGENVTAEIECKKELEAPVKAGQQVGTINYIFTDINGNKKVLGSEKLFVTKDVEMKNFIYFAEFVGNMYLLF